MSMRIRLYILTILTLIVCVSGYAKREELITGSEQITANGGSQGWIGTLADQYNTVVWKATGPYNSADEKPWLTIDLKKEINLEEDPNDPEDIVVMVRRHNETSIGPKMHPTAFNVEISKDGTNWEVFADLETAKAHHPELTESEVNTHIFFQYRGMGTTEYSTRIHTKKTFRYMRLILQQNNSKTQQQDYTQKAMALLSLQIIKLGRNDNYSDIMRDRYHLVDDHFEDYEDFSFEHTRGILDPRNRGTRDLPEDYLDDWSAWSPEGLWTKDPYKLRAAGIEMPKYSYITSEEDPRITKGVRQRTHTIEHELYAVPGDIVVLYPYFEMGRGEQSNYEVSYSHWYDYRTGGYLKNIDDRDLLAFITDPEYIYKSKDAGYFAGCGFPRVKMEKHYVDVVDIYTVDDFFNWLNDMRWINGSTDDGLPSNPVFTKNARLMADLDFSHETNSESAIEEWKMQQATLGLEYNPYSGTFDGNGHTIRNYQRKFDEWNDHKNNSWSRQGIGFINCLGNGGVLKDITFENCEIEGNGSVGIVGMVQQTKGDGPQGAIIQNVKVINTKITANKENYNDNNTDYPMGYAGGIVGRQYYGNNPELTAPVTITDCGFSGYVNGKKGRAGQLTGEIFLGTITNCWSDATVNADGLAEGKYFANVSSAIPEGMAADGVTITNCYSSYEDNSNRLLNGVEEMLTVYWDNKEADWTAPQIGYTDKNSNMVWSAMTLYTGSVDRFYVGECPAKRDKIYFRDGEDGEQHEFEFVANHIYHLDGNHEDFVAPAIPAGGRVYWKNDDANDTEHVYAKWNGVKITYTKIINIDGDTEEVEATAMTRRTKTEDDQPDYWYFDCEAGAYKVTFINANDDTDKSDEFDFKANHVYTKTEDLGEYVEPKERQIIYFDNSKGNWNTPITVQAFEKDWTNELQKQMEQLEGDVYVYEFPDGYIPLYISFHANGWNPGTSNIDYFNKHVYYSDGSHQPYVPGKKRIYWDNDGSNWTAPMVWYTDNDGAGGWHAMTLVEGSTHRYWTADVDGKSATLKFKGAPADGSETETAEWDVIANHIYLSDGSHEAFVLPTLSEGGKVYWNNTDAQWENVTVHYTYTKNIDGDTDTGSVVMTQREKTSDDDPDYWLMSTDCPAGTSKVWFTAGSTTTSEFDFAKNHVYTTAGDQGVYVEPTAPGSKLIAYFDNSAKKYGTPVRLAINYNHDPWYDQYDRVMTQLTEDIWYYDDFPDDVTKIKFIGDGWQGQSESFDFVSGHIYGPEGDQGVYNGPKPAPRYRSKRAATRADGTQLNVTYHEFTADNAADLAEKLNDGRTDEEAVWTATDGNAYPNLNLTSDTEESPTIQWRVPYDNLSWNEDNWNDDTKNARDARHQYGAYATFLFPRCPYLPDQRQGSFHDETKGLDESNAVDDYYIAADFSQTFNLQQIWDAGCAQYNDYLNIDYGNESGTPTIREPELVYRHIFHVMDGSKFAEEISDTKAKNEEYVKKHRRYITARAGKKFWVRLDAPIPMSIDEIKAEYAALDENGKENMRNLLGISDESDFAKLEPVRSRYYYKLAPGDYRRVRGAQVMVRQLQDDGSWGEAVDINSNPFHLAAPFTGEGFRKISNPVRANNIGGNIEPVYENVTYYVGGGGGRYYRMLAIDAPEEGTYKIEIVAKDVNGAVLKTYDGAADLVLQEYVIEFVGEDQAFLVSDETLLKEKKYEFGTAAKLKEKYGDPRVVVNFDEYMAVTPDNVGTVTQFEDGATGDLFDPLTVGTDWNDAAPSACHTPTKEHSGNEYVLNRTKTRWKGGYNNKKDYFHEHQTKHTYYSLRWPLPRTMCDYGTTYGYGHNYNLYRVAQHSSRTDYHRQATLGNIAADPNTKSDEEMNQLKEEIKQKAMEKNDNLDLGLFDRLFYEQMAEIKAWEDANPDKGKDDPERPKHKFGYFYYVNASSDPGVTCRLNVGKLCTGATLYVSAWIAEFSSQNPASEDVANVSFNFVGVTKDGNRAMVHSFVTGNIEQGGEWDKLYFSFTPNFQELEIDAKDVDHYEIELDNNAQGSEMADYAIDNIQVFVVPADVNAEMINTLCTDKDTESQVRVWTPYKNMLDALGVEPYMESKNNKQNIKMYYTFMDKSRFDVARAEEGATDQSVYEASVLKGCYMNMGEESDKEATYGSFEFTNNWDELPDYQAYDDDGKLIRAKVMKMMSDNSENAYKCLAFNCLPSEDNMRAGKEYIIALYHATTDREPTVEDFRIFDDCATMGSFQIKGAKDIKVDGTPHFDASDLSCCENQQPVIEVNMIGFKTGETPDYTTETRDVVVEAVFDWYQGTSEEYYEDRYTDPENKETLKLWQVQPKFRAKYPHVTLDQLANCETDANFTPAMLRYLMLRTQPEDGNAPLLLLYKTSYVVPPTKIPDGQNAVKIAAMALPAYYKVVKDGDKELTEEDQELYTVCTEPVEVEMNVQRHAPLMKNGLLIDYPTYLTDIPVRASLEQLKSATKSAENGNASKALDIPIRYVRYTMEGIDAMTFHTYKGALNKSLYLAATNDPEYAQGLAQVANDPENDSKPLPEKGLAVVGEITEMKAVVDENMEVADNMVSVVFDSMMHFKEGYYYSFKFLFDEDVPASQEEGYKQLDPCSGEQIITLKVVPKYMKWTADENSLNWNNDIHWQRVSARDLYRDVNNASETDTDGSNNNVYSYSPAPWTKVIIPIKGARLPLYEADKTETTETYAEGPIEGPYLYATTDEELSFYTKASPETKKYWTKVAEDATEGSPAGITKNSLDLPLKAVTQDIQYDMVAFDTEQAIACGPWQAHKCEQIDFRPGAAITNQQHLNYEKAWVEWEMTPYRWYALSSPLQGTLAGDMYMPSERSRQETELFQPITYDVKLNNRFAPAVFQRSWNKAQARLYVLPDADTHNGNETTAAIATTWSHVFNDVVEEYNPGEGFSINTDVSDSRVTNFGKTRYGETTDKVLMRLPKADTEWWYYDIDWNGDSNDDTNSGIHGNKTEFTRKADNYRLNDVTGSVTVTPNGASKYFLVGNPFMSDMDVAAFLSHNSSKVSQKFWLVRGDDKPVGLTAVTVGQQSFSNDDEEAATRVAPLQGFFVEAIGDAVESLTLDYTPEMILRRPQSGTDNVALRKPRREPDGDMMTISAVANDTLLLSRAILRLDGAASTGYGEEDAALILDPVMTPGAKVYTTSEGMATMINATPDAEGVEIGLVNIGDEDVPAGTVIRFEDVDSLCDYMLKDVATGETIAITEGMEISVEGNVCGRYFLTRSDVEQEFKSIQVSVQNGEVTVTTGRDKLNAEVYDTLGRHIASHRAASSELRFTLPDIGVYVLKITDGVEKRTVKVMR